MRRLPPVTLNLLIINALFFVGTIVMPNLNDYLAMYYFDSHNFQPYQIITSMFSHANFAHLFFNMFFGLYMFGQIIEQKLGSKNFLKFYLLCGLGATLLHIGVQAFEVYNITGSITNIVTPAASGGVYIEVPGLSAADRQALANVYLTSAVGASGAIYGLFVAFGMSFPEEKIMLIFLPIPIKAKIFIPILLALDFFGGITNVPGDNIAHFAHLGGALFGFLLIKFWFSKR